MSGLVRPDHKYLVKVECSAREIRVKIQSIYYELLSLGASLAK